MTKYTGLCDSGFQESKHNESGFEGLVTMKSRHVELCIAADGNFLNLSFVLLPLPK
jgi:hypothetical protein